MIVDLTNILQVFIVAAALWFIVVFLMYWIFVKFVGVTSVGVLARVLYGLMIALMFFYLMFLSPYRRYFDLNTTPFWIMTSVALFVMLVLVISGVAGQKPERDDY
ncbi:MAG: hypothetical protein LBL96_07010 [Clostridiales bacterium]|jgi:hypothetical protein|nr:hypothetical protein [Clostridiales bacterium]